MKIFVIHRFEDNKKIKKRLREINKKFNNNINFVFLDSYNNLIWKEKAKNEIFDSEAILVYNHEFCMESENAKWEIEMSKEIQKPIIDAYNQSTNEDIIAQLSVIYNFEDEFNSNFISENNDNIFDQYKMMVDSSEKLIERRQKTNAFFITTIGSLLAVATLLIQVEILKYNSIFILYGFSGIGLLLCKSWRNLIDNYGKLNKAKFDVILTLEKQLSAQIYQAEWIALGKGLRPDKYKSFTSTEKNVPLYFGILIIALTFITTIMNFNILTTIPVFFKSLISI
ncbi:MAG: RipA family octameric membrane protein [Nitrososphaeraceae archaeon]